MAVIVFDVNETLLDLSGLDAPFAEVFGDRAVELKRLWFARLVHTSIVLTVLGSWQDFGVIGRAVLADLATRSGIAVDASRIAAIVGHMATLDPHPDVVPGLQRLGAAGVRMVALTNSGQEMAEAQLTAAGLAGFLERIVSVDAVMRFKPDRAVYDHCAEQLGVAPAELLMVATHDWDCAGAMTAGWRSAFLERPGQAYNALLPPPTYRAPDLPALAEQLLRAV